MRPPVWGPDQLERFVRGLRMPRAQLRGLADRLREASWTDAEIEPLTLADSDLGQAQELLLMTARNLRHRPLGGDQ